MDDFLQFLEEIDDDGSQTPIRPRVIRPRANNFATMDEIDFRRRYRVNKSVFLYILHQIDEELEYDSDRNSSISPSIQLMVALRFYATGSHLMAIGDLHGVHESSVSRIITRVTHAIVGLRRNYIHLPSSEEEIKECHSQFYGIARFPNVIGTIDCTHVKIISPGGMDAEIFRNRKGYFSVNVQTVSDAQTRVRNVVARWPGSTHDSAIFTNSALHEAFDAGRYGTSCLLGDNGYPLKQYLLTPFLHPRSAAEQNYNASHIKTRNTVERQYGILKRRFPALAYGLRIKLDTAVHVIIACCVLHNICIKFRAPIPPDDQNQVLEDAIVMGQIHQNATGLNDRRAVDRRALLTRQYFSI